MAIATGESKEQADGGLLPLLALIGGNAALALGPWLVRLTDTGPVAAGFWRLLLPLPLFAVLAWRERVGARLSRPIVLLVLAAGIAFALDLASWHIGIERTRLGNATLFGNSGSLILMVVGIVALRRRPTVAEASAILAALAGAAILFGQSLDISVRTLRGDLFCLLAGVFYVGYLLPAQRARASVGQWSVLLLVCCAGAPVLLAIALGAGEPVWPSAAGFAPVVALAISSQVVGQGLLVFALKHFPPLVIGMALLTQPALAAFTGWLAFGELLSPLDILGMALIGMALVIARVRREKP
ncbi:DMT family transporter [Qipengyuania sp.]|uniref:DMT family transporter n=1 Tax=Qipengyuania sp. TaxID=2004515 RepID=UPI0035C7AC0F